MGRDSRELIRELEADGWRAYYDRRWGRVLRLILIMCQEQFHIPFPVSLVAAYHATRAASQFAPVLHDTRAVQDSYVRFYRLARRYSGLHFDPDQVAALELEYNLVHRELSGKADKSAFVDTMTRLHAAVFGLSLEQALDHTAASSDGSVADELRRVVTELGLGRWRSLQDALEGLDRRNGVPELSSLVGQLRAAHRQGVPVGQVLAAQADALRERRKAEIVEAGGRATVRMVIPIALFVLPVLVIVILVPAGVQLLQLRG